MDLVSKKVAIITGGASGIGRTISQILAKEGYIVVVNYNSSAFSAEQLIAELAKENQEALALQANISHLNEAQKLVDVTLEKYGRIDVLVNNAGINADSLIMRMSEDQFDKVIATNLKGVWNMAKAVVRPMMKNSSGRIINISSVSGVVGLAGQTNYSASKAGVIGLTKALAKEIAGRNITVNAIAPGFIETTMTEKLPEEIKNAALKNIPLGRFGKSSDVANLVAFLASDRANYITGQTIIVDGGMIM